MKYFICLAIIFGFYWPSFSQQINVRGGFLSDSVGIGQQTQYYLTVQYPSRLNVLFPDSTYNYKPFEFENKKYYPTKTADSLSYDSAIYYLSTFEVQAVQHLALPVFVVGKNDSVMVSANEDSITLNQLVSSVPDSLPADKLPLKMNATYQKVFFLFNYPILLIIISIILVLTLIIVFVFGKRINRYFRIRRLEKNHKKFLEIYSTHLNQVQTAFSPSVTEATLATWKAYMEQLEPRPYTKLTSREILMLEKDESLGASLHQTDKAIYGHDTGVIGPLEKLREYADHKYLTKLETVKHGK